MNSILIIEDDNNIRQFTKIFLESEGFYVLEADNGEEGIELFSHSNVDVILLDIMLPNMSGFDVCKNIRKKDKQVGIIMISAKSEQYDKITGFNWGADDYLTKPFDPSELVVRIKSLINRIKSSNNNVVTNDNNNIIYGPFYLDLYSRMFKKDNKIITLTPKEFEIIKLFMQNAGKVYSREELLHTIWKEGIKGGTKIVDVNIRRLREKIENDPAKPEFIETVWGTGYRWKKI